MLIGLEWQVEVKGAVEELVVVALNALVIVVVCLKCDADARNREDALSVRGTARPLAPSTKSLLTFVKNDMCF